MTVRVVEDLGALASELDQLGSKRILVLTTPGRRFVDRLDLGRPFEVFDAAQVHVPIEVVDAAEAALGSADTVVSLGGGAATGLGKALRLRRDVRFVAIPTTYAGSELTSIWGVTAGGRKQTGRDERVRPDVVVHAPELFETLPPRITVTSLLNALAHPIGALSSGLDEAPRREALDAVRHLMWALDLLLEAPTSRDGRAEALRGVRRGASVLDGGVLSAHHEAAHALGGAFGVDHAALHAILLPPFVRQVAAIAPIWWADLEEAAGTVDLPAHLYDALVRVGAHRSLVALGAAPNEALAGHAVLRETFVADATVGRRPSLRDRRLAVAGWPDATVIGPPPERAARVIVALHGRGSDAGSIARLALELTGEDPDTAIVAPQAPGGSWYPQRYKDARPDDAIAHVEAVLAGLPSPWILGFSQGACLAAEVFARSEAPLRGLVALAGARIGTGPHRPRPGTVALIGASDADPWLVAGDVDAHEAELTAAGVAVTRTRAPGDAHVVTALQRIAARDLLLGPRPPLRGFGHHESEALPGAIPRHQNTPKPPPLGLTPELINATGFVAPRAHNRKLWLYRVRPSGQHAPFEPLEHPTFQADFGDPAVNLDGWDPIPLPEAPTDFVDGIATFGGAGSPDLRRGYAIHLYAANRSMDDRAFANADGDLLIVPGQGRLTLLTEAGPIEAGPRQVAIVPRGLRFSVLLPEGSARGWIGEVYGRSFDLPERGPVGSNGLSDPRHFRAPHAWFEDRLAPGFRVVHKLGNRLWQATQDRSPYDAVGTSGNHLPFVYDLLDFSPIGNARVDHIDPSAHTVLTCPMDEAGAATLDFVFFAPRWDVSEHTFRPPFFHRNVTTEFNGIIADPTLSPSGPFREGSTFITPSFTPHGVLTRGVEAAWARQNDRPTRNSDQSAWFQFEVALPLHLTPWARRAAWRVADWPDVWGAYRSHFKA